MTALSTFDASEKITKTETRLAGIVVTDGHRLIVGHAWKFKSNVCFPLLCTVQPLAVKET